MNYLSSHVFRKPPKHVRKNTKAATVEAAEVAAKTGLRMLALNIIEKKGRLRARSHGAPRAGVCWYAPPRHMMGVRS